MKDIKCIKNREHVMTWMYPDEPEKEGYYCETCSYTELEKDRKGLNDDEAWVTSQIERQIYFHK